MNNSSNGDEVALLPLPEALNALASRLVEVQGQGDAWSKIELKAFWRETFSARIECEVYDLSDNQQTVRVPDGFGSQLLKLANAEAAKGNPHWVTLVLTVTNTGEVTYDFGYVKTDHPAFKND